MKICQIINNKLLKISVNIYSIEKSENLQKVFLCVQVFISSNSRPISFYWYFFLDSFSPSKLLFGVSFPVYPACFLHLGVAYRISRM